MIMIGDLITIKKTMDGIMNGEQITILTIKKKQIIMKDNLKQYQEMLFNKML